MLRRTSLAVLAGMVGLALWLGTAAPLRAQAHNLDRYYYYPYYYFPHNYWPTQYPPWPEKPGAPYMKPPPYMAYPPFMEPHWRYDLYTPHKYYRGTHFWLDAF